MRVAAIVVAVLVVVTTPSEASESCMTTAEARQHFGSVHIYWHGPNHCWDATPTRRYGTNSVQRKTPTREAKPTDQPKWRDSMSEMLADTDPAQPLRASASTDARRDVDGSAVAGMRWIDRWLDIESSPVAARWVDIVPMERPAIIERKAERVVRPPGVVLVFVVFVILTLGAIEVLVRWTAYKARAAD